MNPQAHYTLTEENTVIVILQGQPICAPTNWQSAKIVATKAGLKEQLPIWDAVSGGFVTLNY